VLAVTPANFVLRNESLDLQIEQKVGADNLPALTAPEPVLAVMDQDVHGRESEVFS
jgi:hypothetical protein